MAVPESPLDKMSYDSATRALAQLPMALDKLHHDMQVMATATLASAVIKAMGRAVSVQEAMDIQQDLFFATFGAQMAGHGHFQEWAKTRNERLNKVRS